ncbi:hypothetical protein HELRODRAFT_113558 [Helobdella robusta]|uniref:Palmitoyl-protein thioesterase 1 n=1 Tax=Helobdella robusta TaxID=6412 RepID=T1EFT6_HELRO|nr:hypothetical protein HELRODRAFT_113558 [Helobdella robusta]ESN99795.1 hypothetical protein HELRODRAFT_113558 [Helobdella robusta]
MRPSGLIISVVLLLALVVTPRLISSQEAPVPVVLWHGMGDSCCNPLSMGVIKSLIEENIPGVYVLSVRIGDSVVEDVENSFLMNLNKQIDMVCKQFSNDPNLEMGFNAVGFSQGGQFLRGLVQRCSGLKVQNLISIGGQHQGVFGLPKCPVGLHICEYVRELLTKGAYEEYVCACVIVQAEYWHDPLQEDVYRRKSVFLADINQERSVNTTYRENLIKLKNFVLVKFNNETVVVPNESEWFGYYREGQEKEVIDLKDSDIYIKDKLGLKVLDESKRLHFLSLDGDHIMFTRKWFVENIINPYLK